MLTNDELIAVAAAVREEIRSEMVDMWGLDEGQLPDMLTPGMVRAVVRVLGRDHDLHCAPVSAESSLIVERVVLDAFRDLERQWPTVDDAIPDEPEPAPAGEPVPLAKIPGPPETWTPAPAAPAPNGNGHAPEPKRAAKLDSPPVTVAEAAPAKRPASVWAKRLGLADGHLATVVADLETGAINWRVVHNDQRRPILLAFLRWMGRNGWRLTQDEAVRNKPGWLPTPTAWCMALDTSWADLVAEAGV